MNLDLEHAPFQGSTVGIQTGHLEVSSSVHPSNPKNTVLQLGHQGFCGEEWVTDMGTLQGVASNVKGQVRVTWKCKEPQGDEQSRGGRGGGAGHGPQASERRRGLQTLKTCQVRG